MTAPTFARGAAASVAAEGGQPKAGFTGRKNGFGAACKRCGVWVPAQEGELRRGANGWETLHIGGCPDGEAPVRISTPAKPSEVGDGFYTIVRPDGSYRTLRLRTQDEDDQFMPGKQIIGYLRGANNDTDYVNFGHVDRGVVRVWKKHQYDSSLASDSAILFGDTDKAREAYALESGRCSRCNRTLTVPASLHAGVGPECAKKV